VARSLDDPDSLRGATVAEIEALVPSGYTRRPSRSGGGVRFEDPKRPGHQVRIMPGNPNDSEPVKRGPYVVISGRGTSSEHIPLAGNPTL